MPSSIKPEPLQSNVVFFKTEYNFYVKHDQLNDEVLIIAVNHFRDICTIAKSMFAEHKQCRISSDSEQNKVVSRQETLWVSERDRANNYTYSHASQACVLHHGTTNNTLTYAEHGYVFLHNISNLIIIKTKNALNIFSYSERGEAKNLLIKLLLNKKISYLPPQHVLERFQFPIIDENLTKQIIQSRFGLKVCSIRPLTGGRGKNALLVKIKDKSQFVFKFLSKDYERAKLLSEIAFHGDDIFPKPIKLKKDYQKTNDSYLVSIDNSYFILEKFINSQPKADLTPKYFYEIGKAIGNLHNRLTSLLDSQKALLNKLTFRCPPWLDTVMMELDFRVAQKSIICNSEMPSDINEFLDEHLDFILFQITLLQRSEYTKLLYTQTNQPIHGDLSLSHIFLHSDGSTKFIDIETLCLSPRILEFPIALVGRGPGQPSIYIDGSLEQFINGYNKQVKDILSPKEIETTKLLIRHRFLFLFWIRLVRKRIHEREFLIKMMASFRSFCFENTIDFNILKGKNSCGETGKPIICKSSNLLTCGVERVPTYTPFQITYPLEIFDSTNVVTSSNLSDHELLKERLKRNLHYAHATPERRQAMIVAISNLRHIIQPIKQYFMTKHLGLKIVNISLFGSYLYATQEARPDDIDLLIIVRGNHYILEEYLLSEVGIDLTKSPFQKAFEGKIEKIAFSIKGEDNYKYGCFDPSVPFSESEQKPVLERTLAALFHRHIVLHGPEFIENQNLLEANVFAEISDLLINTYHRFYLCRFNRTLSFSERCSKILSRLYEASLYMKHFFPLANVLQPEDLYQLKIKFEKGEAEFSEIEKMWIEFNEKFEALIYDCEQMKDLVEIAHKKIRSGELGSFLPVVARIVDGDGNEVATAIRKKLSMPTKYGIEANHAEIEAIRAAENNDFSNWGDATLYVTLEPCHPCSRALTEFYHFKRVVYGVPDPTLHSYTFNHEVFKDEGVEFHQVADPSVRHELCDMFKQLKKYFVHDSDMRRSFRCIERDIVSKYRKEFHGMSGKDIQVIVFDANLWDLNHINRRSEVFLFRHLEWIKRSLNPKKDNAVLVVGEPNNATKARDKIITEGIFDRLHVSIY